MRSNLIRPMLRALFSRKLLATILFCFLNLWLCKAFTERYFTTMWTKFYWRSSIFGYCCFIIIFCRYGSKNCRHSRNNDATAVKTAVTAAKTDATTANKVKYKYPILGRVSGSVLNNRIFLTNINILEVIIDFNTKLVVFWVIWKKK